MSFLERYPSDWSRVPYWGGYPSPGCTAGQGTPQSGQDGEPPWPGQGYPTGQVGIGYPQLGPDGARPSD